MINEIKIGGDGKVDFEWIKINAGSACITSYAINHVYEKILVGFEGEEGVFYIDLKNNKIIDHYYLSDASARSITISSNGRHGIIGLDDGTIAIFDFSQNVMINKKKIENYRCNKLFFSGEAIIAISKKGEVFLLTFNDLTVLSYLSGSVKTWGHAISSNGKYLYLAGEDGFFASYLIENNKITRHQVIAEEYFQKTIYTGLVLFEEENILISSDEAGRLIPWSINEYNLSPIHIFTIKDRLYHLTSNQDYCGVCLNKGYEIILVSKKSFLPDQLLNYVLIDNAGSADFTISTSCPNKVYYSDRQNNIMEATLSPDMVVEKKILTSSYPDTPSKFEIIFNSALIVLGFSDGLANIDIRDSYPNKTSFDIGKINKIIFGCTDEVLWLTTENGELCRISIKNNEINELLKLNIDCGELFSADQNSALIKNNNETWFFIERCTIHNSISEEESESCNLTSKLIIFDEDNDDALYEGSYEKLYRGVNNLFVGQRILSGTKNILLCVLELSKQDSSSYKLKEKNHINCDDSHGYISSNNKSYFAFQEDFSSKIGVFSLEGQSKNIFPVNYYADSNDSIISDSGLLYFIHSGCDLIAYNIHSGKMLWKANDNEFVFCKLFGYSEKTDTVFLFSDKTNELIMFRSSSTDEDEFLAIDIGNPLGSPQLSPSGEKLLIVFPDKSAKIVSISEMLVFE